MVKLDDDNIIMLSTKSSHQLLWIMWSGCWKYDKNNQCHRNLKNHVQFCQQCACWRPSISRHSYDLVTREMCHNKKCQPVSVYVYINLWTVLQVHQLSWGNLSWDYFCLEIWYDISFRNPFQCLPDLHFKTSLASYHQNCFVSIATVQVGIQISSLATNPKP